jgi:hypothetical protein
MKSLSDSRLERIKQRRVSQYVFYNVTGKVVPVLFN